MQNEEQEKKRVARQLAEEAKKAQLLVEERKKAEEALIEGRRKAQEQETGQTTSSVSCLTKKGRRKGDNNKKTKCVNKKFNAS